MLQWNEISGINKNINYRGNVENGVCLPELNEEVLFCIPSFLDTTKDIYFSGYICESRHSLCLVNCVDGGSRILTNGTRWARFNKPETENNIGYAIAYVDKNGVGFLKDIPNIVEVEKSDINHNIEELYKMKCNRITVFKYIKPCTFQYNWEYISVHRVVKF